MNNFSQDGDVMTVTMPYARTTGGLGVLVGNLFGVTVKAYENATTGEIKTRGVFYLTKLSAQAWTVGQLVYWDDTNKRCTTVSSGNELIGCATAVAANPSSSGYVRLNGTVG